MSRNFLVPRRVVGAGPVVRDGAVDHRVEGAGLLGGAFVNVQDEARKQC